MNRIDQIKKMLQESPKDSFLRHALALENIKTGHLSEAKDLFENLLTDDPGYIGSYYQLARLLENTGERDAAISWYEKGMEAAKNANDTHAYNELRSAFEELTF